MLYRIDLSGRAQRELRVTLEVDAGELGSPVDGTGSSVDLVLSLPVWTPGSYLVREFARHIGGVRATDAAGEPLPVRKVEKNRWSIAAPRDHRTIVSWTVYAHELTVRTSHVTADWGYWNGACVHLWPVGLEDRTADVEVDLPDGWRMHAGSQPVRQADGRACYRLEGLDQAVDTPCLAGPFDGWSFELQGRVHRFVEAGLAGIVPPPTFHDDVRAVVAAAADVFERRLPYERYTFLALFVGEGRGGLEHGDSATLLAPRTTFTPRAAYEDFLSLIAHEFFHVWNVKRMRPADLWRFDYERENYTRLLWVAEGFTAYFDDLIVRRAGISRPAAYLDRIASHVKAMRANPGRFAQSLGDSSFDAWILFYRPDENTRNATQSYYTNGALAALAIDSEVRRCSGGARSLDDVVRGLWGATFEQGRGYGIDDVVACVDHAAGRSLGDFVHRLVEGPFEPDLDRALGLFGLRIDQRDGEGAFLGLRFRSGDNTIASIERGAPAWHAGLCPGDEVLAVADLRVSGSNWQGVWEAVGQPDRPVEFLVARQGVVVTCHVTPAARENAVVKISSVEDPSESQFAHREAWLGSRAL